MADTVHDGLTLEPMRNGDRASVVEVFEGLSAQSRFRRFLSPVRQLTERMLAHLSDVDGTRHLAVVARRGGRPIGIARAFVLPGAPDVAEAAVAVTDAEQGRGVGRLLLDRLACEASAVGVRTFEGHVHPGNAPALSLFRSLGARSWFADSLVRVTWPAGCAPD